MSLPPSLPSAKPGHHKAAAHSQARGLAGGRSLHRGAQGGAHLKIQASYSTALFPWPLPPLPRPAQLAQTPLSIPPPACVFSMLNHRSAQPSRLLSTCSQCPSPLGVTRHPPTRPYDMSSGPAVASGTPAQSLKQTSEVHLEQRLRDFEIQSLSKKREPGVQ